MTTQVVQTGGNVRLIVSPRGIVNSDLVNNDLIFDYSDGTTENVGQVGGSGVIPNALVGRANGDYLVSRTTGDILVGRN